MRRVTCSYSARPIGKKTDGSNSSRGGSVGVSVGGSGLSVFANANKGQGNERGDGTFWTETTVDSGGMFSLRSGRDTALTGAQVSAETVKADVGRNLTLQSQQDRDNYDAKQSRASGGISVPVAGGGAAVNLSMSRDRLSSQYDSVQAQTGIFAGSGGVDIRVGEHTQLDGAVIASTAAADKNTLDTGTLGFSDIKNKAVFTVEHQGGSLSTGGPVGSDLLSNLGGMVLAGLGNGGYAEGTTQAAVSEGTITVRDTENQQQNVDDLSRDTGNANGSIGPIFDKEKEQNRLKEVQLIGEIGGQALDIASTQGKIIATNAANDKMKAVKPEDIVAAEKQWEKANPGKAATAEDINQQIYQTAYNQAFNASGFGTGGPVQRGMQAATAAVQGLAGGNMGAALTGASAPYLAGVIKQSTGDNPAANTMAHAVLGAVTAYASGNNALAGAAGAATAELMAPTIISALGWDKNTLTEGQKQAVSALSTLAAGLAGGLTGDSTADALAGGQAGKNAVENNYLNSTQALTFDKELSDCRKSGGNCQAVIDKWKKVSDEQSVKLDETLKNNPLEAQVWDKEVAQGGIAITERPGWLSSLGADVMSSEEAKAYVQQWNGQDLSKIDVNSPGWTKFAAFASDPENQVAVASLGMLGKDLTKAALSYMGRNTSTATVSASSVGMKWGQGNMKQGMPWEDYVGKTLPVGSRLPPNFKTYDYFDRATGAVVSAKSLDTQTMAKLSNPNQVYSSIKKNIDVTAKFEKASLSGVTVNSSMITSKEVRLAVPVNTTKAQWTEINRAIEYGKNQGVKVTVTQVK
ncbi:adhesin [Yersinia pseudotuberculosis]|nr:adhesin [Yersinia pseudotuberculosis]